MQHPSHSGTLAVWLSKWHPGHLLRGMGQRHGLYRRLKPHLSTSRGWGRVSILWRKSINHLIERTEMHIQRFTAIRINQVNTKPTILVTNDIRRSSLINLTDFAGLQQVILPQSGPTMYAHNGRVTSFINMVLTSDPDPCCNTTVFYKVPWNTSCHTPVTFSPCFNMFDVQLAVHCRKTKSQIFLRVVDDTVGETLYLKVMMPFRLA